MKTFKYRVTTTTHAFPLDMLRYDAAWPATSESAMAIADSLNPSNRMNGITVDLSGMSKPTVGRWQSFGCHVEVLR